MAISALVSDRLLSRFANYLPDDVELWRDPDATTAAPTANRDRYGFPVRSNSPLPVPATGARLVDRCKGQLAPYVKKVRPSALGEQTVPIAAWVITLPASYVEPWNLKTGDELHMKARVFTVVDASGSDSFSPLRLVFCEEIGIK